MWQVESLRNRVSKGKGESRNTRRLDKNEVSDNEPSDKDEKHTFSLTTKQSLKNKPLLILKVKAQGTPVTIIANSEASIKVWMRRITGTNKRRLKGQP